MGNPLKNPPVYFTVAQVRFNTLLKLADFLPSIQEGLRKAGFPAFAKHQTVAIQFNFQQGGQQVPQPVPHERYVFANVDQTHSFVLSTDALTFQSTNYGTFQFFSASLLKGLNIVNDVVALDFTERVGLRYLDHVSAKPGDALTDYLAPEVQGLSARLGGQPLHSYTETLSAFGDVKLRARVVIQEGGLAFPPDLLPEGMVVQPRFLAAQGKHAILDTDGFVEGRHVFSEERIGQSLQDIHEVISSAFRVTVTEQALKAWDQ